MPHISKVTAGVGLLQYLCASLHPQTSALPSALTAAAHHLQLVVATIAQVLHPRLQ